MKKLFIIASAIIAVFFPIFFRGEYIGEYSKDSPDFCNSAFCNSVFINHVSADSISENSISADSAFIKPISSGFVYADSTTYGLIGENVILYNLQLQPITTLPATYFVIITGENETYFSVNYNDLSGYVEKIRVFTIDYEPRLKFASGFFVAQNDTHPVNVRAIPASNAEVIGEIAHGGKAYYYGTLTGEALIPAAGNVWYYVRIDDTKYGYVYSAQGVADSFSVNPGDKMPTEDLPLTPENDDNLPDWVFILLLCVPAIVIMLALFGRNVQKNTSDV